MIRQFELVERVKSYDPAADESALNRAYVYAMKMHGSQKRASGDPYFSHPIEVAGILTKYKLDTASIVTALLHDTIEDTDATLEDITALFSPEIARLVDGVTKLTRIELQSDHSKQAENFRKLLLAMSADIRVLLVKLADRLHNMRTLHYISKPEKRMRIALETMDIYAPLAERIGMQAIKSELEDLAFAELHAEARESLQARLSYLRETGGGLIDRIIAELTEVMEGAEVSCSISGREKTLYSIWRKMQHRNIGFEQLCDIMAFRIIVDDIGSCYQALGAIHSSYPMVPDRFKDYISTPKPNGYRSLHTSVFGPERHRIEVQIRTREMHEVSELGVAAHWQYKQKTKGQWSSPQGTEYRWLRELLDILEQTVGAEEFLEHTKLEMFQDQVFCFTPKGELHALPRGACPVDFAYSVHSEVGDRCVGAKINGRMTPLRTELQNGDQVEIITSKAQTPSPSWERFVVTGKARARIRRHIRMQQRSLYIESGRNILTKAFKQEGYEYSEKGLEGILKAFKMASVEDLCASVGEGILTGREVVCAVYPGISQKAIQQTEAVSFSRKSTAAKISAKKSPIRGLMPGMAIHFAGCCHPLPGDRIVGIVSTGKGVTIHTIDCSTLEQFSNQLERWLDISWEDGVATEGSPSYVGRMSLVVANETNSLGNLSVIISKNTGVIINLRITNRTSEFLEMQIDVEVRDVRHFTNIMAALRASPAISSVDRARD